MLGLSVDIMVFKDIVFMGFLGIMMCFILLENCCLMYWMRYFDLVNLLIMVMIVMFCIFFNLLEMRVKF